jgi:hypothetical protein
MGPAIGSRRARPVYGPDPDHDRPGLSGATACPARLASTARQVGAGRRLVARLIRHLDRPFVNLTRAEHERK